ncbi:hypothetical protein K470DRAFT_258107 [Piedraia hortae CBS 480.64]|uniref:Uncharacterized protein n=1 Tax=Piedraia hortae CBS 480.64 TaxID=1314780 RepID=A0A6A7C091_9PEZI|nr:hypothetical protein K470DRAFT_258107 [Piedraia hortae CBS 480.64]
MSIDRNEALDTAQPNTLLGIAHPSGTMMPQPLPWCQPSIRHQHWHELHNNRGPPRDPFQTRVLLTIPRLQSHSIMPTYYYESSSPRTTIRIDVKVPMTPTRHTTTRYHSPNHHHQTPCKYGKCDAHYPAPPHRDPYVIPLPPIGRNATHARCDDEPLGYARSHQATKAEVEALDHRYGVHNYEYGDVQQSRYRANFRPGRYDPETDPFHQSGRKRPRVKEARFQTVVRNSYRYENDPCESSRYSHNHSEEKRYKSYDVKYSCESHYLWD